MGVQAIAAVLCVVLAAAATGTAQHPEAMSLLGKPLFTSPPRGDAAKTLQAQIAAARETAAKDPSNADAAYALGQADEAAGHLLDAIDAYTIAIERHPDDARLVFARGRLLTVIRKFDVALRDLRNAADTLPEARCRVAFVTYLKGEFQAARTAFKACPASSWAALADARATGSPLPRAPVQDDLVAAYYAALAPLVAKDIPHAREALTKIVDKESKRWMEDTYIAAEADLARLPKKRPKKAQR